MRAATKTSLDDEFTLLLAVGQDTPGNTRLSPQVSYHLKLQLCLSVILKPLISLNSLLQLILMPCLEFRLRLVLK
nr:hypothetical protein [Rothia nasimurium]